jgi:PKD repeat protein
MKTLVHGMKMKGVTSLLALFLLAATVTKAQNCQVVYTYHVSNTQVSFVAISNFLQGTYSWDFGDGAGSTLANPSNTYSQPGIYYVCLTASVPTTTGMCTSVWCDSVMVVIAPPPPPCDANFNWHSCNIAGTTGNTICFLPSSPATTGTYLWDFGDGHSSTAYNPSHTYQQAGTYYVCLTVTQAGTAGITCTATWCDSVTVGNSPPPPPVTCNATFTVMNCNNPATAAGTLCFHSASNPPGTAYLWDFGDGHSSTNPNPVHIYQQAGTYYVCLTVSVNTSAGVACTATWCDSVVVGSVPPPPPPCNANFTWHPCNASGAVSGSICFISGPNSMITSYLWDFGDGHTSVNPNPVHAYQQAGTYYVCLTVTQAGTTGITCTATWCDSVTTGSNPPPPPPVTCNATFTVTNCNNPATAAGTLCFHSASNPPGTTYLWDFGDGNSSTATHPTHHYSQPGSYVACLTVTYQGSNITAACTATWCDTIVVGSAPPPAPTVNCNPNFLAAPCISTVTGANTVCFTSAPNPLGTIYAWNFGDGNSSNLPNPVHTYAHSGNYMVCLTVSVPGITGTIACTATWCHSVMALNTPNILFANPFTYSQKIKIENTDTPLDFYLFDMRGQKIFSETGLTNGEYSLPAGMLKSGIYFYHFTQNGKTISSGKVLIN